MQPYGCGCVLFHDPEVGRLYKHDSPYTYFSSKQLHLGEISLECSRPGAAAVALWATQRLLPLENGGEFAQGLEEGREAGLEFYARLRADDRFVTAFAPELDIVIFLPQSHSVSLSAARSRQIFEAAALRNLHLAVAELPLNFLPTRRLDLVRDSAGQPSTCLRSVLMKAEHKNGCHRIWDILDRQQRGSGFPANPT